MTDEQKKLPWFKHMEDTIRNFSNKYREKFTRGAEEHGGNLHLKPALKVSSWAFEEVLDLVSYLSVVDSHLKDIQKLVDEAQSMITFDEGRSGVSMFHQRSEYRETITKIYNIIHVGNPEGVEQEGD